MKKTRSKKSRDTVPLTTGFANRGGRGQFKGLYLYRVVIGKWRYSILFAEEFLYIYILYM
jgi:hypothetical protein